MADIIPPELLKYFPGVDLSVMFCIGVIAFVLQRSDKVGTGWSMLIPLGLGIAYGIADATAAAGHLAFARIMKGAFLNGAAASFFAHGVDVSLQKLWPPSNKEVAAMTAAVSEAAKTKTAIDAGAVPTVDISTQAEKKP